METYYLIDYENVHEEGLKGIDRLTGNDHVCLMFTPNAAKISLDILAGIKADFKVIKAAAGKQSLDMHIATFMGFLVGANIEKKANYIIISKDTDFDSILKFWNSGDVGQFSRQPAISWNPAEAEEKPVKAAAKKNATAKKRENVKTRDNKGRNRKQAFEAAAEESPAELFEAAPEAEVSVPSEPMTEVSAAVENKAVEPMVEEPVTVQQETPSEPAEKETQEAVEQEPAEEPMQAAAEAGPETPSEPVTEVSAAVENKAAEPEVEEPMTVQPEMPAEPTEKETQETAVQEPAEEAVQTAAEAGMETPAESLTEVPAAQENAAAEPEKEKNAEEKTDARASRRRKRTSSGRTRVKTPAKSSGDTAPDGKAEPSAPAPSTERPVSDKTQLNNHLVRVLRDAQVESTTAQQVASLVVANMDQKNVKQISYRAMIKKFGQKSGLMYYNLIKKEI